ncbi:malate dehydrogenase, mitochondrial-like isoform X1 [Drosophila subobscura]|uniref:malate dehydrogenase, mitochondrial-like isoform X1 n=1 Tax=Drosophila subobscura TaxID=7241 RepID=UPI00155B1580|nr:malate dehydrogenase, mitochondrial-like isoform X1 [Drosophila subobscura]
MFRNQLNSTNLPKCRLFWQLCQATKNQMQTQTQTRQFRVAVIGAAGGIGQPLALLLMTNKLVTQLALHDLEATKGFGKDLSHISTVCKVKPYFGEDGMKRAIKGSHIVMITAGMPRKPGQTRDFLFDTNAPIVARAACLVSHYAPKALVGIITNPVNAVVVVAAEAMKQAGSYDPKRLFGVTTLDVVRAEKFIGEHMDVHPYEIRIPVVGGHAGTTIVPIFSQCQPRFKGDKKCIASIVKRIQTGGDEVVKAKAGKGSATLSMAYAAARFTNALMRGLKGKSCAPECAYVQSDVTDAPFFSTPLTFGRKGIKKNHGLPKMNESEKKQVKVAVEALKQSAAKGVEYMNKMRE